MVLQWKSLPLHLLVYVVNNNSIKHSAKNNAILLSLSQRRACVKQMQKMTLQEWTEFGY
jgi:hypothetical protein